VPVYADSGFSHFEINVVALPAFGFVHFIVISSGIHISKTILYFENSCNFIYTFM
jgi:hypothetical protein